MAKRVLLVMLVCLLISVVGIAGAESTKVTYMAMGDEEPEWVGFVRQENPDIELEVVIVPNFAYDDQLRILFLGGIGPDVFKIRSTYYNQWAKEGVIQSLDHFIQNDSLISQNIIPLERETSTIDGSIYGLSTGWSYIHMVYNQSLFEEAALPKPSMEAAKAWAWRDFSNALKRLTVLNADNSISRWGGIWPVHHPVRFDALVATFGSRYLSENGYTLTKGQVVTALESVQKLIFEDGTMPPSGGYVFASLNQWLTSDRLALYIDGSFRTDELMMVGYEDFGIGALPKGFEQEMPATVTWTDFYAISSEAENNEAAWCVLRSILRYQWKLDYPTPTYGLAGVESERRDDYWKLADGFVLPHGRPMMQIPTSEFSALEHGLMSILSGSESTGILGELERQLNELLAVRE